MTFEANATVQLANPSIVLSASGRELLPLYRDGKPYPAPYKTWAIWSKFKQEGVLPAGVQLTFLEGDEKTCVVSDGKNEFSTPAWNIAPFQEAAGVAELRAAADAGDIAALAAALAAGADLEAEKNGLLLRAVRRMERGSPHAAFIKHLLTDPGLPYHPDVHADDDGAFRKACETGDLALAKWLATSPKLAERVDMEYRLEWAYSLAFHAKQQAVLDWLINTYKAHEDGNIIDFLARQTERALTEAAEAGDLAALTAAARAAPEAYQSCLERVFRETVRRLGPDAPGQAAVVRHLLSGKDLPARADIHADYDQAFIRACATGEAELARWLATSPELAEKSDPYACGFSAFGAALIAGHDEVLRVLIHELDAMNHIPENSGMESDVRSECGTGIADHPKVKAILAERKKR